MTRARRTSRHPRRSGIASNGSGKRSSDGTTRPEPRYLASRAPLLDSPRPEASHPLNKQTATAAVRTTEEEREAVVAEEVEVATGIRTKAGKTAKISAHQAIINQVPGNYMIQATPLNRGPTFSDEAAVIPRLNPAGQPRHEMKTRLFGYLEGQTLVEEGLGLPNAEQKKVDFYFYTCRSPASSDLAGQLDSSFRISDLLADVTDHFTIACVCQPVQIYTCDVRPIREGISDI